MHFFLFAYFCGSECTKTDADLKTKQDAEMGMYKDEMYKVPQSALNTFILTSMLPSHAIGIIVNILVGNCKRTSCILTGKLGKR